jgi:LuxR family transcriptional regulator, maltose regulon positive regulatory protein
METPLLATKLYIPPPAPGLVWRPRLVEKLRSALRPDVRLVLLSAPLGFGKTTAVLEWLQTVDMPAAWLSLDEGDNDLVRFSSYIGAALRQAGLPVNPSVPGMAGAPVGQRVEVVMAGLINDLAIAGRPFVLVLDDYHLIHSPAVHDALAFLIDHQPPHMHLVITSRTDPPFSLAQLRARRQIVELRLVDLRFTSNETASLLSKITGLELPPADVAVLEERTEGWVAALHLAALSLQSRADIASHIRTFSGEHRYILEYLVEEVLQQQRFEIQSFLLNTSILDQLSGDLCDHVLADLWGEASPLVSTHILQELERANLFLVPLDDSRHWYRYHRLFGDFLRTRLLKVQPEQAAHLHSRAAEWYEEHGRMLEAIHHRLAAGEHARAAHLIENSWLQFFVRGEIATLVELTQAIPDDVLRRRPHLLVIQAWAQLLMLNIPHVEERLALALQLLDEDQSLPQADREHLFGAVEALRAFVAFLQGNQDAAIDLSHRALMHLPEGEALLRGMALFNLGNALLQDNQHQEAIQTLKESIVVNRKAGNIFIALWSAHGLAVLLLGSGQVEEADELLGEAMRMATGPDGRELPAACLVHSSMAQIEYERNHLEAAAAHCAWSIELAELVGLDGIGMESNIFLLLISLARSDLPAAQQHLARAEELTRSMTYDEARHLVSRLKVTLALAEDDLEKAERMMKQLEKFPNISSSEKRAGRLLRVEVELKRAALTGHGSRLPLAIEILEETLTERQLQGQTVWMIPILAQLAEAHAILGQRSRAISLLERALALAEGSGVVRSFDTGRETSNLLREIQMHGAQRTYAGFVLQSLWGDAPPPLPVAAPDSVLLEPLSERELEVLRLMARGLSGPEIADFLTVASSTVKSHTKSIYQKLDAHSRYEAVEKARQLKLI